MSGTIRTITDRTVFDKVFYDHFPSNDVFLKTSNGNLKIAFLGYTSGEAAFRIPYIKSMPDTALVFVRSNETTIYAELKTVDKQESDVFIFSPIKIQMISAARKEDRSPVGGEGKNLIFITNAASDFNLFSSISLEKKKIEAIKEKALDDLRRVFTDVVIYFCAEDVGDQRMRFFKEYAGRPLVIDNIEKPPPAGKETDCAYYKEYVYAKEQFNMRRRGFISETTVPILFRGMIPFGFIQINSSAPINPSSVQVLQRAAQLCEQMCVRSSIFRDICTDRLLVSDISRGGNGIVFKDRKYIRFFKEKNTVCYDLILPNSTVIPAASMVKNIVLLENKVIKVGCEIKSIAPQANDAYNDFINKTSAPAS